MTVKDVKELVRFAKAEGLRSLRATVPGAKPGEPDVLLEFTFKADPTPKQAQPKDEEREPWME